MTSVEPQTNKIHSTTNSLERAKNHANLFHNQKIIFLAVLILAGILRFYQLGATPPSINWDEASLGYNAFSILKSGIDEHGNAFPLTNFAAFGDYKPPLYIYLSTIPIALYGLNEFSIRFASAFFGTITVFIAYHLAKKMFGNEKTSLVAAFLLAISPWHLQMSRGAFEGNLGLFFSTLGILLFLKFAKDSPWYVFLSLPSFLAGMYTFTGQRLFIPFIAIILGYHFRARIIAQFKIVLPALILAAAIFYPLYTFSTQTIEGKLRFDEVTMFKDLEPINQSALYRDVDGNSILSRLIHNRRLFFAREYLQNYFDAFDPGFLFANGDVNPRLSAQDTGELFYFELPLLIGGIFYLLKNRQKYSYFIFAWLLISPLGPATARETPHALRMIHILPTFQLITSYGLVNLIRINRHKKIFLATLISVVLISVFYYLHQYYFHYSKKYSGEWQYGYKEAVMVAKKNYNSVDKIIVTKALGRPYIYFLFYNQVPPQDYLDSAKIVKDNFFFYHVNSFDKYIFTDDFKSYPKEENVMYITPSGNLPEGVLKTETIYDLGKSPVFDIGIK